MNIKKRSSGFTLIEVIMAMAIVAIALVSLVEATGTYVKNTAYLKERLVASWVAQNVLNEAMLKQNSSAVGKKSGKEEMAGREWKWQIDTKKGTQEGLFFAEVKVFKDSPDNSLAVLSTYLGEAMKACEQANPQQSTCRQ